jgi:hypothetical protein
MLVYLYLIIFLLQETRTQKANYTDEQPLYFASTDDAPSSERRLVC